MCCLWLSKIDARESDVLALVDKVPAPDFHCPVSASNHMMVAEKGSFEVGFMIRFEACAMPLTSSGIQSRKQKRLG